MRIFGSKPPVPQVPLRAYRARVMREDRGRFSGLRDARVLLYWPHGLGDWVQLAYILPLLEPSNLYWITRYGDDFVALMEGNGCVTPLYSGVRETRNAFGNAAADFHLGVSYRSLDGAPRDVRLSATLYDAVRAAEIDAILWTDFPETLGRDAFPFHSKARYLAKALVAPERLAKFALERPLPTSLDVRPQPHARAFVDERLQGFCEPGQRLCILAGAGHTEAAKDWGAHAGEARRLVALLLERDSAWRFVSLTDRALGARDEAWPGAERVASFEQLFGTHPPPLYAALLKALVARAALFVGVPAGPFHFAVAHGAIACVGIWLAHHPYLYDEPSPFVRHIVGSRVRERGLDRRKGVASVPPTYAEPPTYLATPNVPAETVLAALDTLPL